VTQVLFFIAAIGAITGAFGVVSLRNPFYAVLSLAFHLVSLAVLFLLLRAEFVAAGQVIVYAGAVMVLYVFVVAYVGGGEQLPSGGALKVLGPLFALALAVELSIAVLGSALHGIKTKGAPFIPGFGTPGHIGSLFLNKYLFPFEIASILLLVAAVGAVVLARRRRGLEEGDDVDVRVARPIRGRWLKPPACVPPRTRRPTGWRSSRSATTRREAGSGDRLVPGRFGHRLLHRRRGRTGAA
jgi:NADH-quinone oxidoreductase subunit J